MSKIGKLPIQVKEGVQVAIQGQEVKVTGTKGEAVFVVPSGIQVSLQDGVLQVSQIDTANRAKRADFGLTRALIANMVKGVDTGFERKLELAGVGYRAQMQGTDLVLSLGYSHPVKFQPKQGIAISVQDNVITITGSDKMLVGEAAANIRAIRPPEPYKGKGIKYVGEYIRRKAGKAAKAVGGAK